MTTTTDTREANVLTTASDLVTLAGFLADLPGDLPQPVAVHVYTDDGPPEILWRTDDAEAAVRIIDALGGVWNVGTYVNPSLTEASRHAAGVYVHVTVTGVVLPGLVSGVAS